MAINGNDGHIILPVKVDTKGLDKGANNIRNAIEKTNKSVNNLGLELSRALNTGDTKSAQLINNFKKATEEVEKQSAKVDELKTKLQGLESGEFKLENKGIEKMQQDLEKTNQIIFETETKIQELRNVSEGIYSEAHRDSKGELFFTESDISELDKIGAELDKLESKLEVNKQKANELSTSLKKAMGTSTQSEIDKTKNELAVAENKLQNLSTKAQIAEQKMNNGMKTYSKEVSAVDNAISKLGKKIKNLAIGALVFSAITKAFTELRKTIGSMLMSNEQFRNSVYMLQASLWALSEPIYQSVLPALQSLMNWITKAVLYVATFFSALGGKSLKQTIASAKALNAQATAYKNVAKSSKEARKQVADFDNLDILQEGKASTGANLSGINSSFDDLESLLNDSDMQNLQDFENWVLTHQDSIKTALEIAGLGLLGLAIGGVISKIGNLLGWFKKKDSGLDTQTKKTKTETEAVRELSSAWSLAPAFAFALIPALDGLTASGKELIPTFQTATDKSYGLAPAFDTSKESAYGLAPALDGATSSATNLSPAFQTATDAITNLGKTTEQVMPNVKTNVQGSIDSSKANINTFAEETGEAIKEWSENTSSNVESATTNMAENTYDGLYSMNDNINTFVVATSLLFANWGVNLVNNNGKTVEKMAKDWGSGLKTMWSNFLDFMKATGEKISGFWQEHKVAITTGIVLTGLVAAGIALAPYTGGTSLALPALAKGGIVPHATTALIGEKGKEAVLPLENNTEWMDMLADRILTRSGNINIGGGKEEHYYLNETELMSIVYKLVKGGERLNGNSLISGGAY